MIFAFSYRFGCFLERIAPYRSAFVRAIAVLAVTAILLFAAVPAKDAARLFGFAIPAGLLLLLIPAVRSGAVRLKRRCLGAFAFLGIFLALVDAGVRGFLNHAYGANPNSSFVIESIANTHAGEAEEFLLAALPSVSLWTAAVIAAALAAGWAVFRRINTGYGRDDAPFGFENDLRCSSWASWCVIILVLLSVAAFSVRPWRDMIPIRYWPHFFCKVEASRVSWTALAQNREAALSRAKTAIGAFNEAEAGKPKTIVLVIGESTTRTHWSLYGYERSTTPGLEAVEKADPRFVAVRYAWSTQSSTVASFRDMFLFPWTQGRGVAVPGADQLQPKGMLSDEDLANVFAFFEADGWQTWWISNQDDMAIKNRFAGWADEEVYLNRRAGRSTRSLDEAVIPAFSRALASPGGKKLIVVHLIGAHPHYRYRFPSSMSADWGEDSVQKRFERLGRSPWVISAMNDYDAAMRYQDEILCKLLTLSEKAAAPEHAVSWLYLSDHGQEVGDAEDHTGHSPGTLDGYRIPFLLWSSDGRFGHDLEERPFRSDDLGELLLDIAGIRWAGEDPGRIFLEDRYNFGVRAAKFLSDNRLTAPEEAALMANVLKKAQ